MLLQSTQTQAQTLRRARVQACIASLAGFMGAFASQFWFLAFALTAAANVRTLALIEVLFAQGVAYYSFKQALSARELSGIALIVVGVALLVSV